MKKLLTDFSLLIFYKKNLFLLIWITLITVSLSSFFFIKSKNVEVSLYGVEYTEAAQVKNIIRDQFNTRIWNSSALVVEGKSSDNLVESLIKSFPIVEKIQEITGQKEHNNLLYYLEYKNNYPFNEMQDSTKSIREYLRGWSKKHHINVYMTGNTSFAYDIDEAGKKESSEGETSALIFSFIILVLNFGALFTAFFPIIIGVNTIIFSNAIIRITGIDTNAISQILNGLLGLALAIDYSLFIVSRFREEIKSGKDTKEALLTAMQNSGKTIFFSALIMFCSITVLVIPDVSASRTVVKSILIALMTSLFNTMFFLPLLLIYGKPLMEKPKFLVDLIKRGNSYNFWKKFSTHIVNNPVIYFVLSSSFLLLLSIPVINIKLWEPAQALVSAKAESKIAYDILEKDGWGGELLPINVIVKAKKGETVYSSDYISFIYNLSNVIKKFPGVYSVKSMANFNDNLKKDDYITFYSSAYSFNLLQPTIPLINQDNNLSLISVFPKDIMKSEDVNNTIKMIRDYAKSHPQFETLVGGTVARSKDFTSELYGYIPQILLIIFGSIYLLLYFHMKSLVLPVKAAIMNFLPILSAYGLLVLIFQYGYFSNILKTPVNGAITTMIPITLFCVIFGLSMDYEVLILSRISEYYETTGNVKEAIIEGLAKSGSVITGAALILLGVFAPGVISTSPLIKEICIGITSAIFIDATIVRLFLVPSFMMLMGEYNWWNPLNKK